MAWERKVVSYLAIAFLRFLRVPHIVARKQLGLLE